MCGKSYSLICENLMGHVTIRLCKSWILHHCVEFKLFLKYIEISLPLLQPKKKDLNLDISIYICM